MRDDGPRMGSFVATTVVVMLDTVDRPECYFEPGYRTTARPTSVIIGP